MQYTKQYPKQTNTSKDEWEQKYKREYIFMPFGSLMNAWAVLNQGKDISPEEFLAVANLFLAETKKWVEDRASETSKKETESQLDYPTQ